MSAPIQVITRPGIYPGMDDLAYHADPCEKPSLSSTCAKKLITLSPRHAWADHPRLGGKPSTEEEAPEPKLKAAQEKGTLIHRLVLGRGGDIIICPYDNWRKDAAKAMRDLAKAKGQIPTLPHLFDEAGQAARAAREQLDEIGLGYVFRDGMTEVVVAWQEGDAWLRAKIDWLLIDEDTKTAEIWDLKSSARFTHPEACARLISNMGYDLSLQFHERGLVALRPDLAGRIKKRWVFLEVNNPYAATPVSISGEWEMAAQMRCERAIALWKKCMAENKWPFYVREVARLEPKPWDIVEAFTEE